MRRRAFTLVEVTIVCAILAMVAALALPNVVAMKANRERDEAYNSLLRLAQRGREAAIQEGRTYVLSLEDGGTRAVLQPDEEASGAALSRSGEVDTETTKPVAFGPSYGTNTSGFGSSKATPTGGAGSGDSGGSVNLPEGVTTGEVALDGKASTSNDFKLHFYADGRSEGGGFEMIDRSTTRALAVTPRGLATLTEGSLPQATEKTWEAGQYEQRASS